MFEECMSSCILVQIAKETVVIYNCGSQEIPSIDEPTTVNSLKRLPYATNSICPSNLIRSHKISRPKAFPTTFAFALSVARYAI